MEDWCSRRPLDQLVRFCAFAPVGATFHLPGGAIFICPGEGHFHFIIAPVGICHFHLPRRGSTSTDAPDLNRSLFFVNLPDLGSIFGNGDRAVSCSPVDGIGDHIVLGLHFGLDRARCSLLTMIWNWCSHRSIVCSSLTIPGLLQIFVDNHVES